MIDLKKIYLSFFGSFYTWVGWVCPFYFLKFSDHWDTEISRNFIFKMKVKKSAGNKFSTNWASIFKQILPSVTSKILIIFGIYPTENTLFWAILCFPPKILFFCLKNSIYHLSKLNFRHILRHSSREYSRDFSDEILVGRYITILFFSLDFDMQESRKVTKNDSNLENLVIYAPSNWYF